MGVFCLYTERNPYRKQRHTVFSEKLSASIHGICDMLDISYKTASERCGVSSSHFRAIARGQAVPTINVLERLCIGFERAPNDLLGFATADEELSYRIAMQVVYYRRNPFFHGTYTTFPVCPRCSRSIEREYQPFCDCCGQKLAWDSYHHASLLPGGRE